MGAMGRSGWFRLAALACSLGMLTAVSWAQLPNQAKSVYGQLEDPFGAPLPDASLQLESWTGQPLADTVTDGNGGFVFHGVGPGVYRLRGRYNGQAFERDFAPTNPGVVTVVHAPVGRKSPARAAANPAANVVSLNDLEAPKAAKKTLARAQKALRHHHLAKAMQLGDQAIAQAPHWGTARMFRGVLRLKQGQFALAARDLRAAVQVQPHDGLALTALGADYERQKKLAPAGFYLRRAMQVQPGLWQEYFEMAQLDLDENQPRAAVANASAALAAIPAGPPEAHLLRADGYIRMRQWAKAKSDIQLYLEVAPKGHYVAQAQRTLQEIARVQKNATRPPARASRHR